MIAVTQQQQLCRGRYRCISPFVLSSSFVGIVAMIATSAMILIVGVLVVDITIVAAWVPVCLPATAPAAVTVTGTVATKERRNNLNRRRRQVVRPSFFRTSMSMVEGTTSENKTKSSSSSSSLLSFLDDNEWKIVKELHAKASKAVVVNDNNNNEQKEDTFQNAAEKLFTNLSPALIMKLRNGEALIPSDNAINNNDNVDDNDKQQQQLLLKTFVDLSKALTAMTDRRLEDARDTLETLLNAGEIKKLDALIGKSARNQELDAAFFQVIHMNLQDAQAASVEAQQQHHQLEHTNNDDQDDNDNEGPSPPSVNRFQILQHIYTRCQEEVEKTINPGTALLNKLLRTDIDSIRENQLNHYLCPAPNTITSPDGKVIELGNTNKSLVSHIDFVNAIGNTVTQIRTVEKSGATNAEMAADLVESIRQVAIDARIVIGDHYGGNSSELLQFEDSLEQVFRPTTPDSPYIQGE